MKFKKVKNHGFMTPLHPQQIGAWWVAALLVISYFMVIIPGNYFIHVAFIVIFWLIYGALVAALLYFWTRATLSDPTDRNVVYERECRKEGVEPEDNDELEFFCDVCEAYVHDRTKHCGDCNRCVDLFDHHCKWLNNCVGGANYALFIGLVIVLWAKTVVFVLNSIIFMFVLLIDEDKFHEGFEEFYDTQPNRWGLFVYVLLLLVICAAILFFTSSLLHLHYKLSKYGITAYEFIVYKDEKQERLQKLEEGKITQEQWEEEEKKSQMDMKKKKKSKIIHQISKENKKAYKQKIIERNRKARENTAKAEQEVPKEEYDLNRVIKASFWDGSNSVVFDDVIHNVENPSRVEKYNEEKTNSKADKKRQRYLIEDLNSNTKEKFNDEENDKKEASPGSNQEFVIQSKEDDEEEENADDLLK